MNIFGGMNIEQRTAVAKSVMSALAGAGYTATVHTVADPFCHVPLVKVWVTVEKGDVDFGSVTIGQIGERHYDWIGLPERSTVRDLVESYIAAALPTR